MELLRVKGLAERLNSDILAAEGFELQSLPLTYHLHRITKKGFYLANDMDSYHSTNDVLFINYASTLSSITQS